MIGHLVKAIRAQNVEWELDGEMRRSGRYRLRQYYAKAGDRWVPSERQACEWREGKPR